MLKPILARVAHNAPQAVYYELRHAQGALAAEAAAADKASAEAEAAASAAAAAAEAAVRSAADSTSPRLGRTPGSGAISSSLPRPRVGVGNAADEATNGRSPGGKARSLFRAIGLRAVPRLAKQSTRILAAEEAVQARMSSSNGDSQAQKTRLPDNGEPTFADPSGNHNPAQVLPQAVYLSQGKGQSATAFPQFTKLTSARQRIAVAAAKTMTNGNRSSSGSINGGKSSKSGASRSSPVSYTHLTLPTNYSV